MNEPKIELNQLTPQAAYDFLQKNPRAILVDVRSSMEYLFVGHPKGAIHIPWMDEPDWLINPQFVQQVRQLMLGGVSGEGEYAPIVLICRSGRRSADGGELLIEKGFKQVYNIEQGFEGDLDEHHHRSSIGGWRFRDLPWEQC